MSIVLIGPIKSGKSTVGKLLAERLQKPFFDLGREADRYHEANGIDREAAQRAWQESRFEGFYRYITPFDIQAVEAALAEHPDHVIKLGSVQSFYLDEALRERARAALRGHAVVRLLPSPDVEESLRVLGERRRFLYNGVDITEFFVRHPSNERLAKYRVYTKGRTPEQTVDDILGTLDPAASDIILIGPIGAGKTTVGRLLAERLGLPEVAMDDLRWDYYKEIGFDPETQKAIAEKEGFAGVLRYWKPFEAYAVERLLADHKGCVIHFGAGHSVFEDEEQFARVERALAPYANVVLLLPSPDLEESIAILNARMQDYLEGVELNRLIVTHPAQRELATLTVYTEGKTPEETAEEIARHIAQG